MYIRMHVYMYVYTCVHMTILSEREMKMFSQHKMKSVLTMS